MIAKSFALVLLFILPILGVTACKNDSDDNDTELPPGIGLSPTDDSQLNYADESRWLCLPDRSDACSSVPATSELLADGSFAAIPASAVDDSVDCFYVHPTSDLSIKAGNSENFEYLEPVQQLAQMQAAPFRGTCRIFAPLYHQVTIGTYVLPDDERQPYLDRAAADVRTAFDYYMANFNRGRKLVLIGHSQGSEMLSIILKEKFDTNAALRSQLLLAIIPGFAIHVPLGAARGGTFTNLPACQAAGEVGCVIAYRSYKKNTFYLGDGSIKLLDNEEELCVNPATLDNAALTANDRRSDRASLIGTLLPPPGWISDSTRKVSSPTPFVLANTAYSSACASGPDPRNRYLSIDENLPASDSRHGLVLLDSEALTGITGLHTLDLQFPMAELINLVRARR